MKLRLWARQQGQRLLEAARRAGACLAFSLAWVGAWVVGVWLFGTSIVYAGAAPAGESVASQRGSNAAVVTTSALEADPDAVDPGTAASAPEPLVPRLPQAYPFDGRSRVAGSGQLSCAEAGLSELRGDVVPLVPPARVAEPFRERVRELERVVREVSLEFYGRVPSAILVAASYDCRSVTGNARRISEHSLGNAIDISGFRFAGSAGAEPFEVRVDSHWTASGDQALHSRFLRAFTRALLARDVFRTLLGPAHPDHRDHFHFDMAPHHYVDL